MARNGNFELDDLRPHALAVNVQTGHCHGQREPPGTCAARVQEHDTVTVLDSRTVRVASDDAVKLRRGRVEIELTQIVQDVEEDATDLNNLRSRERDGPWAFVDVAAHGDHGRDLRSLSTTSALPTSPAWMIRSELASATAASGRSSPWVSAITPTVWACP